VLASSYIGQLKAKASQMMRESDFHQVSDKPTKDTNDVKIVAINGDAVKTGKLTQKKTLHAHLDSNLIDIQQR
jgi:hypothetical protein